MMRVIVFLILVTCPFALYGSTELNLGYSSNIINDKPFDIFSDNDWVFGPSIKIEQTIISGRPFYFQLLLKEEASSNKIFEDIRTEFSMLSISGGLSYRHNIYKNILLLSGGLNFIYSLSDIKLKELLITYSNSSSTYGGDIFLGLKIMLPPNFIRSEGWEKTNWYELVNMGLDVQIGYRLMKPISYESLENSEYKVGSGKDIKPELGEINISGPYLITSLDFSF